MLIISIIIGILVISKVFIIFDFFCDKHTPGIYMETCFSPTYNLGIEKDYKFILHTGNMIFIKNELEDFIYTWQKDPLT